MWFRQRERIPTLLRSCLDFGWFWIPNLGKQRFLGRSIAGGANSDSVWCQRPGRLAWVTPQEGYMPIEGRYNPCYSTGRLLRKDVSSSAFFYLTGKGNLQVCFSAPKCYAFWFWWNISNIRVLLFNLSCDFGPFLMHFPCGQGPDQIEGSSVWHLRLGSADGFLQAESAALGQAACGSWWAHQDVWHPVPWIKVGSTMLCGLDALKVDPAMPCCGCWKLGMSDPPEVWHQGGGSSSLPSANPKHWTRAGLRRSGSGDLIWGIADLGQFGSATA